MITEIASSELKGRMASRSGVKVRNANASVAAHRPPARTRISQRREAARTGARCGMRSGGAQRRCRATPRVDRSRFANAPARPLCYDHDVDEALDEKAILERIRAHLGSEQRSSAGAVRLVPPPEGDPDAIDMDVASLRDAYDIYALPFRSQRGLLGPAVAAANRVLRRLLKPSLERQVSYNAANERLVRALLAEMESVKRANGALSQRCDALQAELTALRDAKPRG